ncbi:MAG: putative quinol monooxygenase [Pseudomonadota bacterium]|nr:putative quinol monooxygenase [Pseudomonadota bacterium]
MSLTIVAHINAKRGREALVFQELRNLIEPTRRENGCIQYDLYKDDNAPLHFLFFERWESRELWRAHMNTPHFKAYQRSVESAIDNFTVFEMSAAAEPFAAN